MNLNSSITSPYNMHVPQIYQQYNLKYEELNNRLTKVKKEFGMRRAISSRSLTGETVRVWRMYYYNYFLGFSFCTILSVYIG